MIAADERWSRAASAGRRAVEGLRFARPERLTGPAGDGIGAGIGQSIEFMDFREYEPGDDPRRIDWSAYARSDRLVVRRFREDIRPTVEVYLDDSASMDLEGTPKGDAALALASACVDAARRAGYAAGLWRAASDRAHPLAAPELWPGYETRSGAPPRVGGGARPPATGAVRVLISDLLLRADLDEFVRRFSRGSRWPIVINVLAREDVTAPPGAPCSLRLVDRETGDVMQIEVDEDVRRGFDDRARRFRDSCRGACRRARATFVSVIAEDIFRDACGAEALIEAGVLVGR